MERARACPVAQFTLRMPPKLKEQMLERAERNHRSLNGEMVAVMEAVVSRDEENKKSTK